MKRAIIYARVSTEQQDYERQIEDLKKYAERNDLKVIDVLSEKLSGVKEDIERPQFDYLLSLDKETVDIVLVWELSRLSRRSIHLQQTIQSFIDKGIEVFSYKDNFNTHNPDGSINQIAKMVLALTATIAESEADTIKKRMTAGRTHSVVNKGRAYCGRVLFGYKKDADGCLSVDEEKARIVKEIYQLAVNTSVSRIQLFIESKYGLKLRDCHIRDIIKNTAYYGVYNFKGQYKVQTPAIITKELYYEANNALKARQKTSLSFSISEEYWLRGLIVCGDCGSTYCRSERVRYRCSSRSHYGDTGHICNGPNIMIKDFDEAVWKFTSELFRHFITSSRVNVQAQPHEEAIEGLKKEIINLNGLMQKRLEETKRLVAKQVSVDDTLADIYDEQIREKGKEISEIKKEIGQREKQIEEHEKKIKVIEEQSAISITDSTDKKEFLHDVIERIIVQRGEGRVQHAAICYRNGAVLTMIKPFCKPWVWVAVGGNNHIIE